MAYLQFIQYFKQYGNGTKIEKWNTGRKKYFRKDLAYMKIKNLLKETLTQ